jgi:hypothetical protein
MKMKKICRSLIVGIIGLIILLFFLPVCYVQYKIDKRVVRNEDCESLKYTVYARKLPFLTWEEVYYCYDNPKESQDFIARQDRWVKFCTYNTAFGEFSSPEELPIKYKYNW